LDLCESPRHDLERHDELHLETHVSSAADSWGDFVDLCESPCYNPRSSPPESPFAAGQVSCSSAGVVSMGVDISAMQAVMAVDSSDYDEDLLEEDGGISMDELIENDCSTAMQFSSDRRKTGEREVFNFGEWIVKLSAQNLGRTATGIGMTGFQSQGSAVHSRPSSPGQGSTMGFGGSEESYLSENNLLTRHYMHTLFVMGPETTDGVLPHISLQEQHKSLGRVLGNIFAEHELGEVPPNRRPSRSGSKIQDGAFEHFTELGSRVCKISSAWARRIVEHSIFVGVMMVLTVYTLFAPDLVRLWGTKELDSPFAIINSAVFLLYLLEMVLHSVSQRCMYIFTVVFLLDLLALSSIFLDSWWLQSDMLDEESSQSARMARSARLTRLARITRIARVTRMFPLLLAYVLKQKAHTAKGIILRRLWRTCLFLDANLDGTLSFFDLKFFYGSILQRCHRLSEERVASILSKDVPYLLSLEAQSEDLRFIEFCRVFNSTQLGADLLSAQLAEFESRAGAFQLIRKVSDRMALKLCIGILTLLAALSLVVPQDEDHSSQQGLAQLDAIARAEHAEGIFAGASYICEQIRVYTAKNIPLVLVLDGWVHYEDGFCLSQPERVMPGNLEGLLEAKIATSDLRSQEVLRLCWPNFLNCTGARTAAVLDHSQTFRDGGAWSLVNTIIVIVLLLLYIFILNQKICNFSKTLLQPLRSLLDDMTVLSDLELADIDENDIPSDTNWVQRKDISDEFQQLQDSFKGMRSAIRSWSKYVPPAIVQRLFSTGLEAKIGVVKLNASILFCDINGFEAAVKGFSPEEVLDLLSKVIGTIADIIHNNEGTFLEFIGDEVLAVYNAPRQQKNHVYAAVLSSMQIHTAMKGFTYHAQSHDIPIQCRCGVHSGYIFAGNIGSHQRMKYGLLGDGINLAARLKGLNSRYKTLTLVSQNVVRQLQAKKQRLVFRPVDAVAVKGKTEPTVIYETLMPGCASKPRNVAARHAEAFQLYQQQHFSEAKAIFEEVGAVLEASSKCPDFPSRMLANRCDGYVKKPPCPEWDGVERLLKKSFEEPQADTSTVASTRAEEIKDQCEEVDWQSPSSSGVNEHMDPKHIDPKRSVVFKVSSGGSDDCGIPSIDRGPVTECTTEVVHMISTL